MTAPFFAPLGDMVEFVCLRKLNGKMVNQMTFGRKCVVLSEFSDNICNSRSSYNPKPRMLLAPS